MDRWTDRLSEYLDDGLNEHDRARLEEHLAACAECRGVMEGLRAVIRQAGALQDRPPANDLWPRIRERIEAGADVVPIEAARPPRGKGRLAFTFPQAAAAGIALMLFGATTAWFALRDAASPAVVADAQPAAQAPAQFSFTGQLLAPEVQQRLTELEAALDAARERLDPATVAVIVKNLTLVETAVREAEEALARDPANQYLREHLVQTLRTKVGVLERVTDLARAET